MLELTETARKELESYFKDKDMSPIRVYLAPGGCSGPRLSLALDDPRPDDEVLALEGGLTFVVEKQLYAAAQPITVDVTTAGFAVSSNLELGGGGCSCSSGCGSTGSCC